MILDAFLQAGHHVSVEDLLRIVHRRHPEIGRTTIYRTLKLFTEAGLASELLLGGEARFEPIWKREHHDHFVCRACGEILEFYEPADRAPAAADRGRDRLQRRGSPPPRLRPVPRLRVEAAGAARAPAAAAR